MLRFRLVKAISSNNDLNFVDKANKPHKINKY